MNNPKQLFSHCADDYEKYRPRYPKAVIEFLKKEIGLKPDWNIADIASGTGISSELFVANKNHVFGVEPDENMRKMAELKFKNNKYFTSVNGSAENTKLKNNYIDCIIAGQAFHWFDYKKARLEFKRIGKQDCIIILIWNSLDDTSAPFMDEYNKFLKQYEKDRSKLYKAMIDESVIADFYGFKPKKKIFSNQQIVDADGLLGKVFSLSFMPKKGTKKYEDAKQKLLQMFKRYNVNNKIKFKYNTKMYYGIIK